jgi:hypothetical protein
MTEYDKQFCKLMDDPSTSSAFLTMIEANQDRDVCDVLNDLEIMKDLFELKLKSLV